MTLLNNGMVGLVPNPILHLTKEGDIREKKKKKKPTFGPPFLGGRDPFPPTNTSSPNLERKGRGHPMEREFLIKL